MFTFTLRFTDADGEWHVTARYSRWRTLFTIVQARWPRALQEPSPLAFPPKSLPAYLVRATPTFVSDRAVGIERFVRKLLDRAARDQASGLEEWLHHWLRQAGRDSHVAVATNRPPPLPMPPPAPAQQVESPS